MIRKKRPMTRRSVPSDVLGIRRQTLIPAFFSFPRGINSHRGGGERGEIRKCRGPDPQPSTGHDPSPLHLNFPIYIFRITATRVAPRKYPHKQQFPKSCLLDIMGLTGSNNRYNEMLSDHRIGYRCPVFQGTCWTITQIANYVKL